MTPKSIQTKMSAILIFTATIILSGFAMLDYFTTQTRMRENLKKLAEFISTQQSKALVTHLWDLNRAGIENVVNSAMIEQQVYAVLIRDDRQRIVFGKKKDENWKSLETNDDVAGAYIVSIRKIENREETLGTVEVYLTPKFMELELQQSVIRIAMTIIFLNLALLAALITSVQRSLIKPVSALVAQVKMIASGHLDTSLNIERHDEIGQLASDVEKMRLAIIELTTRMAEAERLKTEMELARRIQSSLLPTLSENVHPDFHIAAIMLPAEEVGGDFYDVSYDRSGKLWLAIGDVSGHGVTPGLIMMMAQTIHATVTANLDCEAREVVIKINDILFKNVHTRLNDDHFMTFTALKYLGDGRFQYAGSHLDLIVYRCQTGTCEQIETTGTWLNLLPDISDTTTNAEFHLAIGDTLVLYTDGLTEAWNQAKQMLDIHRLMQMIQTHALKDVETLRSAVIADVMTWCDQHQDDDMSLVLVRRVW